MKLAHGSLATSVLVVVCIFLACSPFSEAEEQEGFVVAAAASLANPLEELLEVWNAEYEVRGRATYAGSGTLARQIEEGAPYDLFCTADARWSDHLVAEGLVDVDTERELARNALVLACREERLSEFQNERGVLREDEITSRRWTTGDPATVPLGSKAEELLRAVDLWDATEDKLVAASDARAALRLVERGEVDWGVLYRSDVTGSEELVGLSELGRIGDDPPVAYFAMHVRGGHPRALAFLEWVMEEPQRAVFERHGFEVPPIAWKPR